MTCTGCGAALPEGANACSSCGRPVIAPPPPPPPGSSLFSPIKRVASGAVGVTKNMASDLKQGGKEALGEAKIAAHGVGNLTRKVVDEIGKGLEDAGKEFQKASKKNK
jgi:hypothetical protein